MNLKNQFKEWMESQPTIKKDKLYEHKTVQHCVTVLNNMLKDMNIEYDYLPNNTIFDCDEYLIFSKIEKDIRTNKLFVEKDGRGPGGKRNWYDNGMRLYGDFLLDLEHSDEYSRPDKLESMLICDNKEGKKTLIYSTKYERSQQNRNAAIREHGLECQCCGFNYELFYGDIGKNYIEVHHCVPLSSLDEEITVNPRTDLVCICANCHRMIHRQKYNTLSVDELKKMIARVK